MKYRRYLLLALLLLSRQVDAWCKLTSPGIERRAGNVAMEYQNLQPAGQSFSVPLSLFHKRTHCDKKSPLHNKVHINTSYTQPVVIRFYDNIFIELTIKPMRETLPLKPGYYSAEQFLDQLTVTAKVVGPTSGAKIAKNGSYSLNAVLIISAATGSSDSLGEFLRKLATFLLTGKWPATENDLYQLNLNLALSYKPTTCRFENKQLKLQPVAIHELSRNGPVNSAITAHTLSARCTELHGDQTNRAIRVTLSGDTLLAGNPQVILPSNGVRGVGFMLYDERHHPITLGGGATPASVIKHIPKWTTLHANGFSIPLNAGYYVYDHRQVKPGKLKANVTIHIDYD
ncbi:fimbrial protein [Edwardsiella tarda]|uniref:fimbrial protein n=1 Tax=Edwardsiella tarda TaxID=636 RepID=UPI00351C122D